MKDDASPKGWRQILSIEYTSEEELEEMIIEHYKEIFGLDSLYFAPQTMKTHMKIESRNDGIILTLNQDQ